MFFNVHCSVVLEMVFIIQAHKHFQNIFLKMFYIIDSALTSHRTLNRSFGDESFQAITCTGRDNEQLLRKTQNIRKY